MKSKDNFKLREKSYDKKITLLRDIAIFITITEHLIQSFPLLTKCVSQKSFKIKLADCDILRVYCFTCLILFFFSSV